MTATNDDPKDQNHLKLPDSEWIHTISETPIQHPPIDQETSIDGFESVPAAKQGDLLGSGKIVSVLGEGGMGRVYKIWCEDLELYRAVKVILHSRDAAAVRRFQREAKLTAKLDHTNIVRIFSTGIWRGCRYIEMEYIEGTSFDVLLRQKKRFNTNICAAIGLIVARVLAYAHNHSFTLDGTVCTGVVHRDLKPSNLMLTTTGKLKVLDFGIARPLSDEVLSLTTGIVGSMYYLPPEQLDGSPIDYRADIYALGAMLYELASGQVAFPFTNHREFYYNKSRGIYTPLDKVSPDISSEFSSIIDCCLSSNPKDRYSNASELINELKCFVAENEAFSSIYDEDTDCLRLDVKPESGQAVDPRKTTRSRVRTRTGIKKKNVKFRVLSGILLLIICCILIWRFSDRFFPGVSLGLKAPALVNSVQESPDTGDSICFVWRKVEGATFYDLELSLNKDFSKPSQLYPGLTDTNFSVLVKRNSKTLFWRVVSGKKEMRSLWSETGVILTSSLPVSKENSLLPPVPKYPLHNQKDIRLPVNLRWQNMSSSVSCRIQIASDSIFRRVIREKNVTDTVFTLNDLSYGKNYFWRIGISISEDSTLWSSVMAFRTEDNLRSREEQLSTLYNSTDLVTIALKAIGKGNLKDAEEALKNIRKKHPVYGEIVLRLADAYLNMKSFKKAKELLAGLESDDALFFISNGRILLQDKRYNDALKAFKNAQSRSSAVFDYHRIIRDASYYYAETSHGIFLSNPTYENKENALKAWEVIITKLYKSDKSNYRFKNAVKASNEIAQIRVK